MPVSDSAIPPPEQGDKAAFTALPADEMSVLEPGSLRLGELGYALEQSKHAEKRRASADDDDGSRGKMRAITTE